MPDEWVLLVPVGVEVTQTVSAEVDEPMLATRTQLVALVGVRDAMKAAGIPFKLRDFLRRLNGTKAVPVVDVVDSTMMAEGEHERAFTPRREPEFPCICGRTYGSESQLKFHQHTCGMHNNGLLIPKEHQVD